MLKIFNFLEALSWKTLWLRFLLIKNMLRITGKYTSYIYLPSHGLTFIIYCLSLVKKLIRPGKSRSMYKAKSLSYNISILVVA